MRFLSERKWTVDTYAQMYEQYRQGDTEALVMIMRDLKDGLILYLHHIVGDLYTAEELAEDTFVKLVVKRPRFKGRSTFKTFLYAVARNTAVDFLRKNAACTHCPFSGLYDYADHQSLEQQYIKTEQNIMLHRALDKLPAEYRQVLYLSYFEEFGNAEIAAVLKKNKRQIENILYRAKGALRKQLEKEGFDSEGL